MSSAALVLVCALELLGRSLDSFPAIHVVDERPRSASATAEAFVDPESRSIVLIGSSPAYRAALKSALAVPRCRDHAAFALLASIIAHEEWHILHGPGEEDAYLTQLSTLQGLGYNRDSGVYQRVLRAMMAVTRKDH